jgi:hypothetical protein
MISICKAGKREMAFLKKDAMDDFQKAVLAVELQADDCWKQMRLLKCPRNLATWALLTSMALKLELLQQEYGPDSVPLRNMTTLWELCTCGFVFIAEHGKPESKLVRKYSWNGMLITDAAHDLEISREYTGFQNIFPMWHYDMQAADILADGRVRFAFERDSPRQRQVIALQQTVRPAIDMQDAPETRIHRVDLSKEQDRIFWDFHDSVKSRGLGKKFDYESPGELIEIIRPQFEYGVQHKFRHPDDLQLGGYTSSDFRTFYVALMILCGIHERLCYPFIEKGYPIPESSLVMVKPRRVWVTRLAQIAGLSDDICSKIVGHLTMDPSPTKTSGMAIHPFVPLDRAGRELAVAPQFVLSANPDDNILRALSYRDQALFSAANTQKEKILRTKIRAANNRFNLPDPINLPDRTTDIDLIIEDSASSTLVLAELKWIRKPLKPKERAQRNADVDKGVHQISLIRAYARAHPDFLKNSRRLTSDITSFANVYYLLIVADHWIWVEPEDGFAILDFQAFLTKFSQSIDLNATVTDLLTYDWLPKEGVNFRVKFDVSTVNGAIIESPSFHYIK